MDEIPGGFWRVVAEDFVHDRRNKTFFGRTNLKFGACAGGLWPYMLELGGILATKYGTKPDAFVSAFLGMSGEAGAAKRFLVESATNILRRHSLGSMKFSDYVGFDVADRLGYKGNDWSSLIMERGAQKCPPNTALSTAWGFASRGATLGTLHPEVFRAMFERTHTSVPPEEWQRAYAAGLDIGPKQPKRIYAEAERSESSSFLEYCRQFAPDRYAALKD